MPWRRAALRAHSLLQREPGWVEPWSGLGALLWGAISFFGHGDITDRPAYVMLQFLAARVWEILGFGLGLGQIVAIAYEHRIWRKRAAFCLSGWWLLLTLSLVWGDPSAPAWGLFFSVAMSNIVAGVVLARRND